MRTYRLALLALPLFLTGCSLAPTASPSPEKGLAITGQVHGGQQPIVGAHVYLFAANTTGYGGNNIAASSANASVSLLNSVNTGHSDSTGAYVLTDSTGSFTITGDYTCTSGQQVYLYALGGNPGAGTNSASGMLAILGNCPAAGTFAATIPSIWINEVSTIAAAYAFAGFATDATHVSSSGTALAQTGIANAFANAANLVNIATGAALSTPVGSTGTVPQSEINTLANILASCVNSASSSSTACTTLFNNAKSAGATGTTATDTATAAINIAHNPGANVATLYTISAPTVAFAPHLSAQPNDFTIAVTFTHSSLTQANGLAIDASGNPWISNSAFNTLLKFSPLGAAQSGASGYSGGGLAHPGSVTIDPSGSVWVVNGFSNSTISKFNSAGTPLSGTGFAGGGLSAVSGIAADAAGNIWPGNFDNFAISEFNSLGVPLSGSGYNITLNNTVAVAIDGSGNAWTASYPGVTKNSSAGVLLSGAGYNPTGGSQATTSIAIDSAGNAWAGTTLHGSIFPFNSAIIIKLSPAGASLSGSSGFTGGGLGLGVPAPQGVALDGAGNVWCVIPSDPGTLCELSSTGTPISGSSGYQGGTGTSGFIRASFIALDGSGNVWIASPYGYLVQFIGVSTPVITPIVAGLPSTPTADGSSNLGTRP